MNGHAPATQSGRLVPDEAYLALAGASTELIRSVVRTGQTDALPGLEETIVSLHLALLAARPWTA